MQKLSKMIRRPAFWLLKSGFAPNFKGSLLFLATTFRRIAKIVAHNLTNINFDSLYLSNEWSDFQKIGGVGIVRQNIFGKRNNKKSELPL